MFEEVSRLWRTVLWVVLAATAIGCGGGSHEYVRLHDVDAALAAQFGASDSLNAFLDADGADGPDREEYRISWVNLCKKEPCGDPIAQKYTELFREIAVTIGLLRQIEFVVTAVADGKVSVADAKALIGFAWRQVPGMKDRVTALMTKLQALTPQSDFAARPTLVPRAVNGAVQAATQLKDAAMLLPELIVMIGRTKETTAVASGSGEAPVTVAPRSSDGPGTGDVRRTAAVADEPRQPGLRLHPQTRERIAGLKVALEKMPAYAPSGELSEEDVLRIATIRGVHELERELRVHQQLSATEEDVRLAAIVLTGPEEAMLAWFLTIREEAQKCVPTDVQGEVELAGLHDRVGRITGVQSLEATLPPDVVNCVTSSVSDSSVDVGELGAGTFAIRLTTEHPQPVVVEQLREDDAEQRAAPQPEVDEVKEVAMAPLEVEPITSTAAVDIELTEAAPVPARKTSVVKVIGLTVGGAAALTGGGLGIGSLVIRSNARRDIRAGNITEAEALAAQARHNQLGTWSLVTGLSGLGIVGTTLLFTRRGGERHAELSVSADRVVWTVRF